MSEKKLTWLGHNTWLLRWDQTTFLVDPYFQPSSPAIGKNIQVDYLLVSHGHSDHCAGVSTVLKQSPATVVAMAEAADWFTKKGAAKTEPMNIGGSIPVAVKTDIGPATARLMMTSATHSSTMPDGSAGGSACGFLLSFPKSGHSAGFEGEILPMSEILAGCFNIYFACDTGWFSEMERLGRWGIDAAVLPIGDRYTLGPSLSLDAITSLRPKKVFPSHYNTWQPISQNVELWAAAVEKRTSAKPVVLNAGESFRFEIP